MPARRCRPSQALWSNPRGLFLCGARACGGVPADAAQVPDDWKLGAKRTRDPSAKSRVFRRHPPQQNKALQMTNRTPTPAEFSDLRSRAASKLTGDSQQGPRIATAALGVLHGLASSPATAPDALALLHELQVHQVELDLQAEELRGSRIELEAALRRQIELYDAAPFGYLTVDLDGTLLELNLTGAAMLGGARDMMLGQPLSRWLTHHSAQALLAALANFGEHDGGSLQLHARLGDCQSLSACVRADPAGNTFLVAMMDASVDAPPTWRSPPR